MNTFVFQSPAWLWLLWLLPALGILFLYQSRQQKRDLAKFRDRPIRGQWQLRTTALLALCLGSLILSLARPGWNPSPSGINEQGRDVIFLLDVSRSMLAADARPNRLEVARHAIRETVNGNNNDRFGLAVFAGQTAILSPLTNDSRFLNNLLDTLGPHSVAQGGTSIEEALLTVTGTMISREEDAPAVDLILISDGEDLTERDPNRPAGEGEEDHALAQLNALGVRLMVIGLGDSQRGARVPARDAQSRDGEGWTLDNGQEHWSRMDTRFLRSLAQGAEQGVFFPVGTASLDLADMVSKLRLLWPGSDRQEGEILRYTEGYPWLLALALLSLLLLLLRRGALSAGLLLLSFHAGATADLNGYLSDAQLRELSLTEQHALALTRIDNMDALGAAGIYRIIAADARDLETAITANYNLGTALIQAGHQLERKQRMLDENGEIDPTLFDPDDPDFFTPPEWYFDEASEVLRLVLRQRPDHQGSARNLEWLTVRRTEQEDNEQAAMEMNDQGNEGDDTSESEQNDNDSEQDDGEGETEESDSQGDQEGEADTLSEQAPQLPPPTASQEDILEQARQRDQQQRQPVERESIPVERDW
ncbi:VWA domain-containing protein [Ferrimonas pelagia]|uniref:VWFA domain-containing protein n=1 Tax=Ferrimonas pelagia TaxID=1177826 RepID=A0ABP9EIY1_9GAMM